MNLTLDVFLFTLVLINTVLHSIGFCLLIILYRKGKKSSQQIYFINLSVAEALLNLMEVLTRIPEMFSHSHHLPIVFLHIEHYAKIINLTGIWVIIYSTMVYVTVDRFLTVRIGIKQRIYWTKKKVTCLLSATWVICLLTSLSISIIEIFHHFHYQPLFYKYFYPSIDFGYIILAISVYSYIFYRHQKSCKMKHKWSKRSLRLRTKSTTTEAFRESRFYTTILLVLTFLLFIIIPDLVYMFFGMQHEHFNHSNGITEGGESNILFDLCRLSYAIASTVDFFIYIFFQPAVQAILCVKYDELMSSIKMKRERQLCSSSVMEIQHINETRTTSKVKGLSEQKQETDADALCEERANVLTDISIDKLNNFTEECNKTLI